MLSNKDFLSFLQDETIDTSSEDALKKIIDEESAKPIEDMNTLLIEHCLDAIAVLQNESQTQNGKEPDDTHVKHKRITYKKILILAAAVAVLFAGILYVSADREEILFGGIVEVFNDHVRINFSDIETEETVLMYGSALKAELAANGFDGVVLPEIFCAQENEIVKLDYNSYDMIDTVTVFINCGDMRVNIFIDRYAMQELIPHTDLPNVTSEIVKVETQSADVFCCEQGELSSLNYRCGLDLYTILLYDTSLETAVELAKTVQ
ncbi:MAG: hypothetical protein IJC45_10500 [Clostridia bacterium]|nr:hypothetical protein [Clostridia bacterium]